MTRGLLRLSIVRLAVVVAVFLLIAVLRVGVNRESDKGNREKKSAELHEGGATAIRDGWEGECTP